MNAVTGVVALLQEGRNRHTLNACRGIIIMNGNGNRQGATRPVTVLLAFSTFGSQHSCGGRVDRNDRGYWRSTARKHIGVNPQATRDVASARWFARPTTIATKTGKRRNHERSRRMRTRPTDAGRSPSRKGTSGPPAVAATDVGRPAGGEEHAHRHNDYTNRR